MRYHVQKSYQQTFNKTFYASTLRGLFVYSLIAYIFVPWFIFLLAKPDFINE